MRWIISLFVCLLFACSAVAEQVSIAVASNFLTTAEKLADAFEDQSDHVVVVSHGATGQLFAQIENGAPFDVFLAADAARPLRLEEIGRAAERKTYAFGRLFLVSKQQITRDAASEQLVGRVVALADPTVAPYGLAATRTMERLALDTNTFKPVLLANVAQVATVFATGNADAAFVAASQLPLLDAAVTLDLDGLYDPIQQDAVLLARAADNPAAAAFWAWLSGPDARGIISSAGYGLP